MLWDITMGYASQQVLPLVCFCSMLPCHYSTLILHLLPHGWSSRCSNSPQAFFMLLRWKFEIHHALLRTSSCALEGQISFAIHHSKVLQQLHGMLILWEPYSFLCDLVKVLKCEGHPSYWSVALVSTVFSYSPPNVCVCAHALHTGEPKCGHLPLPH